MKASGTPLVTLLALVGLWPNVSIAAVAPTYVFEGRGVMTGQPPISVASGEEVQFAVIEDNEVERAQVRDIISTLADSIDGIDETLRERMKPDLLTLGVTSAQLDTIRNSYCRTTIDLVATLPISSERDAFNQRLLEACRNPAATPAQDFLPAFSTGAASYQMSGTCRDIGSARTTLTTKAPATPGYITFVDSAVCAERAFELRLVKPLASAIDAWSTANPMPQEARLAIATARSNYKTLAPILASRVETHKPLYACLQTAKLETSNKMRPNMAQDEIETLIKEHVAAIAACAGNPTLAVAYQKLRTAYGELEAANSQLGAVFTAMNPAVAAWAERWLWLSGGHLTLHPLAADTVAPLNRQLKAKKEELVRLDAQLAILDKLTAAGVKIDNPSNLVDTVAKLGATRADREKVAADIADLAKKIAGGESSQLRDTLLYQGTYFTSAKGALVRMQHHDASLQYVIMGPQLVEATENERIVILAENADPSAILKLVQTVAPITTDRSKFVDELRLTTVPAAAVVLPPDLTRLTPDEQYETISAAAAAIIEQYELLARGVAFADIELTSRPSLVRLAEDSSPSRITRPIPQDPPRTAPADVTYTITETVGTENKEVGKGGYRRNRLYRVRFKTGLLYSTLEKTNVITNATTSERTEEVSQHGVDALFGVATYLGPRRDPRTIDSFSTGAWSLLTAMTVRDPTENLLIGVGFEPYGGVTLTIGGHVGRSERIRNDPGQPSTEDEWRARPFFAITFDVDFLKQLFSIKPSV